MDRTTLSFGVNLGWPGSQDRPAGDPFSGPAQAARWAEEAGFDVVTTADHYGSTSPFVMLAAAAAVTTRVRLRTYVLNVGFWNPGLLARDVATLDVVSGGRVDVGIGAGHKPLEHEALGIPYPPYRARVERLAAFAGELRRHLEDPQFRPAPVQRPVPVFVGAMSPRALAVAARVGEVVALGGGMQLKGAPPGTLTFASAEQTDARVAEVRRVREQLDLPSPSFDALLQQVVLGRTVDDVGAEWEAESGGAIRVADVAASPFLLAAPTAQEAAAELARRSERWGITSWCTHAPSGPALAEVLAVIRS
jgi:probable F420-dependent oxidoreductase